jgi:hypothetical protein
MVLVNTSQRTYITADSSKPCIHIKDNHISWGAARTRRSAAYATDVCRQCCRGAPDATG